jgi:integrase
VQRGSIIKRNGFWLLRYREPRLVDGKMQRVRAAAKLAPVSDDYPNKRSVLLLAEKILAPLNAGQVQAESSMSVKDFITKHYLPYVEKNLRASTHKDYKKDAYEKHLEKRLGDIRLRDFRTVTGQRLMRDIDEKSSDVGHKTLLRIKSFLSGAFKHARREGFIDTPNPMIDVSVPGRPAQFKGNVYTVDEINDILQALYLGENAAPATQDATKTEGTEKKTTRSDGQKKRATAERIRNLQIASVVISVAALTGLRLSELKGLRWSDFDGVSLTVRRSVWRTKVSEPKTQTSAGSVPVLPVLQEMLIKYRVKMSGGDEDYIFRGSRRGAPLNLENLVARVIKPQLNEASGEMERLLKWKGWHAFRRGLATNLYSLGIAPKVIQAILRHSDIGTTLSYYVQTPDSETRDALRKMEEWMKVV